jgi:NADPH2:quinone reductase
MVPGGYAEERLIRADRLVKLPDDIPDEQAAAMMLQGLTAQYLLRTTYPVQPGDTILVHAAAGGVGLIMCQWAKHLGATVIGTVGSDEKAEIARAHGCDHPIVYTREDFVARVKEITGGKGLPVVYDGVGKDTFERGLDCLRPRGVMASFGQSSGKVPPLDIAVLGAKGSLYVTRAGLASHIASRADLEFRSQDLFEVVRTGAVRIEVRQRYRLSEVKQAHLDLEARRTTGSTVLVP